MKVMLFALALSTATHAAMNMKPGLWEVQVDIENNGKKINVSEQISQAMAKLTPEQQKKMQAMMGNMAGPQGTRTCFTQEMLTPEQMLKQQSRKKCDMKFTSNTPSLVAGTFQCEDGTKGDMKWESAPEMMKGTINMDSPKRGKGLINLRGKFLTSDCGKVKPATAL